MDLMTRRRALSASKADKPDERTYTYEFVNNGGGALLDVTAGQTLTIVWDCPNGTYNGWVLNGNGLTSKNLGQLQAVGYSGTDTVNVIGTGQVRVGAYSYFDTFSVKNGTIVVTVIDPN